MIDPGGQILFCSTKRSEDGDQMILLCVAGTGIRGFLPVEQGLCAICAWQGQRFVQPGIKGLRRDLGTWAEVREVVIAEAGSHDQNVFIAQGSKGAAQGEMLGRAVAVAHGT